MIKIYLVLIIPEGNVTAADIIIFYKAMENLIRWSGNEKYLFDDGNVYEIRAMDL